MEIIDKPSTKLDEIFLDSLEELPHDIRRIIYLLSKGMGSVFISRLIGGLPCFVRRKIRWIKNYFIFIYLRHQYKDEIDKILKEKGCFKRRPDKWKKEGLIFKYMWERPYLSRKDVAEQFNVADDYISLIKNKYMKFLLEGVCDQKMHLLVIYFNKCVFLTVGKNLLSRSDFVFMRKSK